MKKRVLIADDHAFVSWGLAKALGALEEVEIVGTVANGIDAIDQPLDAEQLGIDAALRPGQQPDRAGNREGVRRAVLRVGDDTDSLPGAHRAGDDEGCGRCVAVGDGAPAECRCRARDGDSVGVSAACR